MKGHLRRWLLCGVAVTALLGALGGFAYAKATSDNTINACAKTANGQLRLDTGDGCLPSEQAVQWNQTGPQGLQGPQGIQGPAGISHVDEWSQYLGIGGGVPIITGSAAETRGHRTTLQTFHLDKGQFLLSANVIGVNNSGEGVVVCTIGNAHLGIVLAQAALGHDAGFAVQQTMQLQGVFPVDFAQDLELQCFNAPQGDASPGAPMINYWDITAAKIDSSTFNGVANP